MARKEIISCDICKKVVERESLSNMEITIPYVDPQDNRRFYDRPKDICNDCCEEIKNTVSKLLRKVFDE